MTCNVSSGMLNPTVYLLTPSSILIPVFEPWHPASGHWLNLYTVWHVVNTTTVCLCFLLTLLVFAASGDYSMADQCLSVCVNAIKLLISLLLQFLYNSHETWHTRSVWHYATPIEQDSIVLYSNQSMPVANESGASTQPWRTPASILNHEL